MHMCHKNARVARYVLSHVCILVVCCRRQNKCARGRRTRGVEQADEHDGDYHANRHRPYYAGNLFSQVVQDARLLQCRCRSTACRHGVVSDGGRGHQVPAKPRPRRWTSQAILLVRDNNLIQSKPSIETTCCSNKSLDGVKGHEQGPLTLVCRPLRPNNRHATVGNAAHVP
eukprot:363491-Chlamydomonas_euryale.AAC.4